MRLRPDDAVTPEALASGRQSLVVDAAFANLTGALSGGVILGAFALSAGAGPMAIGLLGAIPFLAQAAQLPAIGVVERLRQRRVVAVLALAAARLIILATALLPLLANARLQIGWLIASQVAICVLSAFAACAVNSWLHQLVPRADLGGFFARRLFWGTALACVGTLVAGWLAESPQIADRRDAFAIAFAAAGAAGLVSCWALARTPEPRMTIAPVHASLVDKLREPFHDRDFRRVLVFMGAWAAASNVAAPFLTVFLLQQLRLPLGVVTTLWVVSQVANALTLYLWGRLSDRLSNKAVLAVALPVYFGCTLGLVFTDLHGHASLQRALLVAFHVVMGAASGGIGLAVGNLGLKLAPQGRGTPYLAVVGLVSSLAGGLAPLVAGAVAEWFAPRELSVFLRWVSPSGGAEIAVFDVAHWEVLFAISALLGLYVMHALSRISEGEEISERRVMQQFGLEALRSVNHLSSVGGLLGTLFPFGRLLDRPWWGRERRARRRGPEAGAAGQTAPP